MFCLGYVLLYSEHKIQNVEQPNTSKNDTWNIKSCSQHHKKSEAHQKCDRNHNLDFCVPCHTLSHYKGFKVVLIKLCADKPFMQLLRSFSEAEQRKHQKRKCREHRDNGTDSSKPKTEESRYQPNYLLNFHRFSFSICFFSRLLSITCRITMIGWLNIIRGPENRITARIFSRISAL